MTIQRFDEFEAEVEDFNNSEEVVESNLSKKLERRRRIEELFEEKRLRQELAEFDLV
ncbi:PA3496 family putative envelope integrity protein [Legionella jordanis]|uniref:Uncharacterized protein n=1 Tax=Legionella jordanis TaxID=456 RepID=A0A0W0V998_9GAMM|nr:hypothetical protein [Legionella jordanis]KTD16684.1 hypothetical protein Ljor_0990 [Legionella jordanis]VEH11848.1 Uncharacterised protein [Legionella jordanis]